MKREIEGLPWGYHIEQDPEDWEDLLEPWDDDGKIPAAGPVTVTRADGTVYVLQPLVGNDLPQ